MIGYVLKISKIIAAYYKQTIIFLIGFGNEKNDLCKLYFSTHMNSGITHNTRSGIIRFCMFSCHRD